MIFNARKLQYRRLRRINSQYDNALDQDRKDGNKIINLMDTLIKHVKTQFSTISQFRKIINQKYDKKALLDKVDRIESLYRQAKVVPEIEISLLQISVEAEYFRMFYFRMVKEVSFYISSIKVAQILLENIEELVENQIEKQTHPIIYIFRFTRNKLLIELERLYKIFIELCKIPQDKKQQLEDSLRKRIRLSIRKKQELTVEFTQFLFGFQNTFYSCLDLECIEVVNLYLPSVSINSNIDLISRKQIKRNKRIRKDIKCYKINYEQYQEKKNRTKSKHKIRKLSVSKLRQKTESIETSHALLPSLQNQKDSSNLKEVNKQKKQISLNKLSKNLSFEKNSKIDKIQDRQNLILPKEFLVVNKQFHRQNFRLKLQTLDNYKKLLE